MCCDRSPVCKEVLLALQRRLSKRGKFRLLANRIEQRIFVHGGIRTVAPLNRSLQLAERGARLSRKAQYFSSLVELFCISRKPWVGLECRSRFADIRRW